MGTIEQIIKTIDDRLIETGKEYLLLSQANQLLVSKNIISITEHSNRFLKQLLEENKIPHAYQTQNKPKQWRIPLSEKGKQEQKTTRKSKPFIQKQQSVDIFNNDSNVFDKTICPHCGKSVTFLSQTINTKYVHCNTCGNNFCIYIKPVNKLSLTNSQKNWILGIAMVLILWLIVIIPVDKSGLIGEIQNSESETTTYRTTLKALQDSSSGNSIKEDHISNSKNCQGEKDFIINVKNLLTRNLQDLESKYNTLSPDDFSEYLSQWNRNANEIKTKYQKSDFDCFLSLDYNRMLSSYQQAGLEFINIAMNRGGDDYSIFKQRINESFNLLMDSDKSKTDKRKEISSKESINKDRDRRIVVWANKYYDGNISFTIGIFTLDQQCAWIPGTLTLKIFDDNDNLIKTHKQKVSQKHPSSCEQFEDYFNVYLGNRINQAKYIKALYNAVNGQQYSHDYIYLKWAL